MHAKERMKPNFNCDGLSMSLKFSHLAETVAFYDPDFWSYLKMIGADDLLFCYRWLILELKREFAFEDALRMMEVCFASLPYKPQDVPLFEVKFTLSNAHAIPIQVANNSLTSSYSRVCALRRSSTSLCGGGSGGLPNVSELRGRRFSRKPKANPLSLDENSLTSVSSISTSLTGSGGGGSSFGGSVVRSHTKPFYSLDETTEGLSACDFMTGSPFEMLNLDGNLSSPKPKKLIKNLKEFWTIAKGSEDPSPDSTPFSSKSSTMSNLEAALGPMTSDSDCNGGAVFFDDLPPEKITSINSPISVKRQNVISTSSPPLTTRSRHSSCNSSSGKVIGVIPPRMTTSSNFPMSAVATATPTKTSGSTSFNPISPRRGGDEQTTNLSKSENKSEQFANHDDDDDNNSSSRGGGGGFLPIPTPASDQDPERTSQTSNADSEHDSGHCYGNSTELFESLNDPQFSRGRAHVKMPSPDILGGGNPFLMFLCLTLLLQHRDHIMKNGMDYNETAMYFDKLIRKHNVGRVLAHARMLYSEYLKNNAARA
ncbi:Small G protein signaling modulator 2 [Folsomia candida]|uniref:Small G protein signaling modulator 2 n=1 Tax=Folsomia candida TaxID=158441 RepID=A0A226DE05_FOLCA|nr:Small G protein signaling modulator 2 [Folsomia candida]